MPTQTFTEGDDTYTVSTVDSYVLSFLGGNDTLTVIRGQVDANMGTGNDVVSLKGGLSSVLGGIGADRFELYNYDPGTTVDGEDDADLFNVRGGTGIQVYGGAGNDRFNFYAAAASVLLYGGSGDDKFFGYNNVITGSIYGDDGADYFVLFRGAVSLHGGPGNDIYRADAKSPATFVELADEGRDSVQVARGASYTLPANIENISVQGFSGSSTTATPTLQGNDLANTINAHINTETIYGWGGDDRISAKSGNDTVYGGDGDDFLDGGPGNDILYGEAGNDTLQGRTGNDTMVGGPGDDSYYVDSLLDVVLENSGEGFDTIRVTVSGYTLADNVEKGIISGTIAASLTGNDLDNFLYGNSNSNALVGGAGNDYLNAGAGADGLFGGEGNDILIGGTGADEMYGGAGDDIIHVDNVSDTVHEFAGEGTDTVYLYISSLTLAANVENAVARTAISTTLTGNELANVLTGNNAADTLTGLTGADILTGGGGNDRFVFTAIEDSSPGSGIDQITDFATGDLIDLSAIDANPDVGGDQAFSFSESAAAHSVWVVASGAGYIVYADVTGDAVADFELHVAGVSPGVTDFGL